MSAIYDKHGNEIKAGDTIFNPHDRDGNHLVIEKEGKLFIGDYDSPIERYRPEWFWEIVSDNPKAEISGRIDM